MQQPVAFYPPAYIHTSTDPQPDLQTIDYAPRLDAPAAALLSEEELAVCTTSHKPRQLAAFKMQHLLAEAEPHIPHSVVRQSYVTMLVLWLTAPSPTKQP